MLVFFVFCFFFIWTAHPPWRHVLSHSFPPRRSSDLARHAGALDADLLHHRVDQRRLRAVAQRALDHLVGRRAMAAAAAAAAAEAVDVENADAVDLLQDRKSTRLNSSH